MPDEGQGFFVWNDQFDALLGQRISTARVCGKSADGYPWLRHGMLRAGSLSFNCDLSETTHYDKRRVRLLVDQCAVRMAVLMVSAINTVNSNIGFFMCSTTDFTTPKNGHVSHFTLVTVTPWSCCASTCIFSVWCVQMQVQLPSSVDTAISCVSQCECVLA